MLGDMHRIALLAALCTVPMLAAVDTVRRGGIPKPYWGTWAPPAQRPDQTNKDRIAEWFKTCMDDWERATHMTKAEWRITCRRVADERGRFVAEQQSLDNLPKTDKKSRQR
jgi:hypothetical protein